MAYEAAAPWLQLTPDNHAAWIVVSTFIFYIYAILSVTTKILIRFNIVGLQSNDYVLFLGTVIWTVAVVCLVEACTIGLGRHQPTLDSKALSRSSEVKKRKTALGLFVRQRKILTMPHTRGLAAVLWRPHPEPCRIGVQQSLRLSSFPRNQQFWPVPRGELHLDGHNHCCKSLRHCWHGLPMSHAIALVAEKRGRLSRSIDHLHF